MYHVQDEIHSTTVYGSASARKEIPRYEMAEEELDPRIAKRFIADELQLVRHTVSCSPAGGESMEAATSVRAVCADLEH